MGRICSSKYTESGLHGLPTVLLPVVSIGGVTVGISGSCLQEWRAVVAIAASTTTKVNGCFVMECIDFEILKSKRLTLVCRIRLPQREVLRPQRGI